MDSTLFRWGAVAWWWVGPNPPQVMQFWGGWVPHCICGWVPHAMQYGSLPGLGGSNARWYTAPSPMQYGSLPPMLFWVTACHAILGHRLPCYSGSPPAMLFWVTASHAILGHRLPCYSGSPPAMLFWVTASHAILGHYLSGKPAL